MDQRCDLFSSWSQVSRGSWIERMDGWMDGQMGGWVIDWDEWIFITPNLGKHLHVVVNIGSVSTSLGGHYWIWRRRRWRQWQRWWRWWSWRRRWVWSTMRMSETANQRHKSTHPQLLLYSNLPWFNCMAKSGVWKFKATIWQPAFQNICTWGLEWNAMVILRHWRRWRWCGAKCKANVVVISNSIL